MTFLIKLLNRKEHIHNLIIDSTGTADTGSLIGLPDLANW